MYKSPSQLYGMITSYLSNLLVQTKAFADADNFRFRGTGISGTATKNASTNIDYKLTEERWINGVRPILTNHVAGDSMDFEIVDVDNVLGGGAGVVLDQFGKTWYVNPDNACQGDVMINYPAKVLINLYIRIVYNSVGTENDVAVGANLYLHKKIV